VTEQYNIQSEAKKYRDPVPVAVFMPLYLNMIFQGFLVKFLVFIYNILYYLDTSLRQYLQIPVSSMADLKKGEFYNAT